MHLREGGIFKCLKITESRPAQGLWEGGKEDSRAHTSVPQTGSTSDPLAPAGSTVVPCKTPFWMARPGTGGPFTNSACSLFSYQNPFGCYHP